MATLFPVVKDSPFKENLDKEEMTSLLYHDVFDYPLTYLELIKWRAGREIKADLKADRFDYRDGYYFIAGKERSVLKRVIAQRISVRKMHLAETAARLLALIPFIDFVGITGSLAMNSAQDDSDIDLIILTKKGRLWMGRFLSVLLLDLLKIPRRRYGEGQVKDKLCLNMWLDSDAYAWPKKAKNAYTAHEIAQIQPLVNKNRSFEKFLFANRWVAGFWPSAVKIPKKALLGSQKTLFPSFFALLFDFAEALLRRLQMGHMRGRITREVVTRSKAVFHPNDWTDVLRIKMSAVGIEI